MNETEETASPCPACDGTGFGEDKIFAFDSDKAAQRVSRMWAELGEKIASFASQQAVNDPAQAIRDACCAEACFWKATGEADTHDVKDVIAFAGRQEGA